MRTRTKWIVAGGAAAFVLTPVVAVHGSTALDSELTQTGVVVDAEAANRARAARTTTRPTLTPTAAPVPTLEPSRTAKTAKATKKKATELRSSEPTGKKTVSAASPVSPRTAPSAVSPNTPG